MFCPNCGKELPEEMDVNEINCDNCGYKSKPEGAVPPPLPKTPPVPSFSDKGGSRPSQPGVFLHDKSKDREKVLIKVFKGLIAVTFVILLIGWLVSDDEDFQTTPTTSSSSSTARKRSLPSPAFKMDSEKLWEEFSANRIAAEQKYEGKLIAVKGFVDDVQKGWGSITVFLPGNNALVGGGVVGCELPSSEEDYLANVEEGSLIEVVGKCDGMTYFGIVEGVRLTDCRVSKGASASAEQKPVTEAIRAEDVVKAFMDNEVAAGKRFIKQTFTIVGSVKTIDRTAIGSSIHVVLSSGDNLLADVYCFFPESQASAVAKLSQGQRVAIQGTCESFDRQLLGIGNLRFRNCRIVQETAAKRSVTEESKPAPTVTATVQAPAKSSTHKDPGRFAVTVKPSSRAVQPGVRSSELPSGKAAWEAAFAKALQDPELDHPERIATYDECDPVTFLKGSFTEPGAEECMAIVPLRTVDRVSYGSFGIVYKKTSKGWITDGDGLLGSEIKMAIDIAGDGLLAIVIENEGYGTGRGMKIAEIREGGEKVLYSASGWSGLCKFTADDIGTPLEGIVSVILEDANGDGALDITEMREKKNTTETALFDTATRAFVVQ